MTLDRWLAFLGLGGTLLFGLLTVLFYYRPFFRRRLDVAWSAAVLQQRRHPRIRMTFDDVELAVLSRVRFLLSNSGTAEVRQSDIPPNGELTVRTGNAQILSAACIGGDVAETNAQFLVQGTNEAKLTFTHFNRDHLVILELLLAADVEPSISGQIMGGTFRLKPIRIRRVWDSALLPLGVLAGVFAGRLNFEPPPWFATRPGFWGVISAGVGIFLLSEYLRRRHRRRREMMFDLLENA